MIVSDYLLVYSFFCKLCLYPVLVLVLVLLLGMRVLGYGTC